LSNDRYLLTRLEDGASVARIHRKQDISNDRSDGVSVVQVTLADNKVCLVRRARVMTPHALHVHGTNGAVKPKDSVYLDEVCVQDLHLVIVAAQWGVRIIVRTNFSELSLLIFFINLIRLEVFDRGVLYI